ncbi:alpha/beta hydrolase [Haloarcula taiwanensis]|uniref:Alpha/beta hydrolase n=1 Tax=Haloarcula taiwanensis TaxID=1932004 RepID=A0A2H4ZXW0_9EURY|nr:MULTISPECIES: alpha/beta hydrolase [Haloarcula]AUG47277.1 alpha/beta hydrolase [Haloarcula taiwanensis]RLM34056.1 alpha/beta fold hydrolase [Haloarcula sp. Atlit-120R]RLM42372.1 alpha/beta fold hydrolase [Haloarcula sp. Atlit-47R]RLM95441.1 alpha/beta fold hydrolase [Haloarcula sp. Atlit-7R]
MERVSHHGRVTAYRQTQPAGGGPTALYVHGSGATHRVWGRQYAPSGPTHPAVALDMSGHGESDDIDTAAGTTTLDAYADDVVAVGRETDADVLVGNSLGGAIAQWVALERDWAPEAIVLLGTGPELPVFEGLQEWLADDWDRAVEFLHERDRLFHDIDHAAVSRSREQMEAVGQAVTRRDFMTCHGFDVRDRLGEIDVPVLAVCGEHDKLTPRAYHETLASEIPDGEVSFVPDAAHLAMVERAEVFNDTLTEFIEEAV